MAFPDLPEPLARVVTELGWAEPTPIQAAALPLALAGHDLVARARTGSGKTAAFALPLLARTRKAPRCPQALVLCPTRELAAQVAVTIRTLGRRLAGLRVLVLGGGEPGGPQRRALEEGVHVVVGTPGRVQDHLERGGLDVSGLRTLVLDEADRMLDMGFAEQVERILGALPEDRLTLFFSATYPTSIADMSARWQREPRHVAVDEPAEASTLRQVACVVEDKEAALVRLCAVLPGPALVFSNLRETAQGRAAALRAAGVSAAYIGGDLEQRDREQVLAKLRNGSVRVLVATDVAARGLDVDTLPLVVNVDLPSRPEVYVHRVGRTARAGRDGLAVALAWAREEDKLRRYEAASGAPIDRRTVDALVAEASVAPASPEVPATGPGGPLGDVPMATLRVGGGRKDKLRPGDLLGALTGEAGFAAADVGRIEIHDHHAFVAVSRAIADAAVTRLREGRIKGRRFRVERV